MPARFDLDRVKQIVQEWLEGNDDRMWFTPRKKSYGAVGFVLKEDDSVAQEIIAMGIVKLNASSFCQQTYLSGRGAVADVYGLEAYRGHNWYVKFFIHEEEGDECLASVSFHPLDVDMKLENGQTIEMTYSGDRPWKSI